MNCYLSKNKNKSYIDFESNCCPQDHLLIAVSGGVDSIACAHFLIKRNTGKNVSIFHFNHKLSEQNNNMEQSVCAFAKDFNVSFYEEEPNISINAKNSSIEHEARQARINGMNKVNHTYKFNNSLDPNFVMCHHLDDAIESYFMNFLEGRPEELIPPFTNFGDFSVYRPFMLTRKATLIEYARKHNLMKYVVEDETNKDTKIFRNWARQEILPKIFERYSGLYKVVGKKVRARYDRLKNNKVEYNHDV